MSYDDPPPPRVFRRCRMCGGPRPQLGNFQDEMLEIVYYRKPGYDAGPPDCGDPPDWPNAPAAENIASGEQGFFVRCKRCSYAWYEPLEPDYTRRIPWSKCPAVRKNEDVQTNETDDDSSNEEVSDS